MKTLPSGIQADELGLLVNGVFVEERDGVDFNSDPGDDFEERANPYHDKLGKFAKHSSSGSPTEKVGKDDPDMLIMNQSDTYPFGSPWQGSSNMEKRAGGLWSESYAGHKQVTKAVANNKEGKPTLEDVPLGGHQYTLLQAGAKDLPDGTRAPGPYKEKNLKADIRNAAAVLQNRMDNAPTHKSPLYRGILMNRKDLPQPGDTFETPISSWAKRRDTAEVYAYARSNEDLGIIGDHHVVLRMVGSKKSADIGDIVGSGIMDDEHLFQGKVRVRRITRKGKSVNIEVEQVND